MSAMGQRTSSFVLFSFIANGKSGVKSLLLRFDS
jgi:hypothetical protein